MRSNPHEPAVSKLYGLSFDPRVSRVAASTHADMETALEEVVISTERSTIWSKPQASISSNCRPRSIGTATADLHISACCNSCVKGTRILEGQNLRYVLSLSPLTPLPHWREGNRSSLGPASSAGLLCRVYAVAMASLAATMPSSARTFADTSSAACLYLCCSTAGVLDSKDRRHQSSR